MPSLTDAELPTLPQVALLLIEMCGDPEVDLDDIVETISLDVALSAALIRTANSAHYGQQYRVDTLRKAAMVVGTNYVKAVALGFQLAEASSHWKDVPIDLGILWRGNLLRSCLARYIAQGSSLPALADQGQAFLVGLLQDLAVPIAARRVGSEYTAWLGEDGLYTTDTLVEAERARIDDDHASLADALCRKWEFPEMGYPLRSRRCGS